MQKQEVKYIMISKNIIRYQKQYPIQQVKSSKLFYCHISFFSEIVVGKKKTLSK